MLTLTFIFFLQWRSRNFWNRPPGNEHGPVVSKIKYNLLSLHTIYSTEIKQYL